MKLKSLFKGLFIIVLFIPCILFAWGIGGELVSEFISYNKTIDTRYAGRKMIEGSSDSTEGTWQFNFISKDTEFTSKDTISQLRKAGRQGENWAKFEYGVKVGDNVKLRVVNSKKGIIKGWQGLKIQSKGKLYPLWKTLLFFFLSYILFTLIKYFYRIFKIR